MIPSSLRFLPSGVASLLFLLSAVRPAAAQSPLRVDTIPLRKGHAIPFSTKTPISKVTVANPDVANVVVTGVSSVVVNANALGDSDVLLLSESGEALRHLRVSVREDVKPAQQVHLGVKFAEVRTSVLQQIAGALSYQSKDGGTQGGFGSLRNGANDGNRPNVSRFVGALSTFNSGELLALLEAEVQRGNARFLAEPTLTAAMGEQASFLAGGEIPIPLVQGGAAGQQAFVTIQFREFGVRLSFKPMTATDSLMRLFVKPEVSSLDYSNAVTLQGFQVPALRTRRVESTVDVMSDRSLVISGLFNEEREQVRTGIPLLMDVPLLGSLFSSRRWLSNESELVVIVTPMLVDSTSPRLNVSPDKVAPRAFPLETRPPQRPPEPR